MSAAIFYVYVLFRPWNGEPFYVGKGKGERWLRFGRPDNKHFRRIVAKAKRLGLEIPSVKVRDDLTESEAFATERALIGAIGRGKNGPLVNLTDGGDGVSGRIVTEKEKADKRALYTGRPLSPEHRAAISAAQKGRQYTLGHKLSPEHIAKIVAANRQKEYGPGKPLTAEAKEKLRKAILGRKHTAEARTRMSEAQRKRTNWRRGYALSESHRANLRIAALAREARIRAEKSRLHPPEQLELHLHIAEEPQRFATLVDDNPGST